MRSIAAGINKSMLISWRTCKIILLSMENADAIV
jgi:hypothetical protein